ncbi:HAMP domain-containing sensor histidine kinase [Cesiribacter sp. SM1]|uniref:sensor histidine kinase n=1 Tax=Cesiribacter sp. SM1 TaxID=2861196 RepID=UPI001CD54158|nr:HAMP domain-containing sensor histidine kinase [Cesiribacter sp. SM1]
MKKYNSLLEDQLQKHLPSAPAADLEPLLEAISKSYDHFEQERELIEHDKDLNSKELLEANEELKKTNSELDRFVYSVSHDLRAPITSVLGLIQITRNEQDPEVRAQYFMLMESSLRRLDNFIHDIIDYSRNNRLESKPEAINFDELTEEVAASLRFMPDADIIALTKDFSAEIPFYTDRQRLKVILTNLISNAVRYYNPRQDNPYILFRVRTSEESASLEVSDNGIGIEEEYLPRIFDMFFRAHQESKGSGLGLYIVKETVMKLGGEINVSSTFGEGTSFAITLPNKRPQ